MIAILAFVERTNIQGTRVRERFDDRPHGIVLMFQSSPHLQAIYSFLSKI
jgi:hypothetical protein